jgi:hypothetical protein
VTATERVTITLPADIVRDIDRLEDDRSRFLQEAARHELQRRRQMLLRQSLQHPHPETDPLVDVGFDEWVTSLPDEDAAGLISATAGIEVRWVAGEGWTRVGQ